MPTGPLRWIDDALAELEHAGLRRSRRVGAAAPSSGRPVANFGTNDYLGLAADPRVGQAAAAVVAAHGWGAGASPAVCGRSAAHERLEQRLADFEGAEAAILFPSGFAANAGAIPALVDEGDALYADAKNHASLIDGCRLARAERFVYPHGDADALAEMLRDSERFGRRLIVTDGLFSMDGDFAPIGRLAELAERHEAMLLVDEAHATGVWGATGRGAVERWADTAGAPHAAAIRVGTLSKALGGSGGFVTGSRSLIDWLANRARPYVFSTATPAAVAAAALAALEIAVAEPERRARVVASAERLRRGLRADGWDTGPSESQIVPILVGDPDRAVALSRRLLDDGVYVPAIRPPSVPAGESLLRASVTASHTEEDLDRLLAALRSARSA